MSDKYMDNKFYKVICKEGSYLIKKFFYVMTYFFRKMVHMEK